MPEGVELRKCASFNTKDRIMNQYCDRQGREIEQNFECRGCIKMQKQIKENSRLINELLKDKNLRHDVQELPQDIARLNRSIEFFQNTPCSVESSQEPGNDKSFVSHSECSKQTNKTSEDNRNNHAVDSSLGRLSYLFPSISFMQKITEII